MRTGLMLVAAAALVACVGCGSSYQSVYGDAKEYQKTGDYEQAIANYQTYIAEAQNDPTSTLAMEAYEGIAESYRMMGSEKKAEAIAAYKKLLELYPTAEGAELWKMEIAQLEKVEAPAEVTPTTLPTLAN